MTFECLSSLVKVVGSRNNLKAKWEQQMQKEKATFTENKHYVNSSRENSRNMGLHTTTQVITKLWLCQGCQPKQKTCHCQGLQMSYIHLINKVKTCVPIKAIFDVVFYTTTKICLIAILKLVWTSLVYLKIFLFVIKFYITFISKSKTCHNPSNIYNSISKPSLSHFHCIS